MTNPIRDLINGYLDDLLTPEQHAALSEWIQSDVKHARQFAESIMLHDRLRGEFSYPHDLPWMDEPVQKVQSRVYSLRSLSVLATAASVALIGFFLFWSNFGQSSVSAAMRELDRIIEMNVRFGDRSYQISVEKILDPPRRGKQKSMAKEQRPPKVSLDRAIVHVRSGNQFVLIRKDSDGEPFITGSDGQTSWAVRSKGPVRVSHDLSRFNRDLPGHENAVPLTNIHEGLEHLRQTYDVQFLSTGPEEYQGRESEAYRMLVAIKKPKQRGPQRVEIAYESNSGCIREMRFIQMPYGTDLLDLRMTLVEEKQLDEDFFDHHFHHTYDRMVEIED
jgi:hypothetical protein